MSVNKGAMTIVGMLTMGKWDIGIDFRTGEPGNLKRIFAIHLDRGKREFRDFFVCFRGFRNRKVHVILLRLVVQF